MVQLAPAQLRDMIHHPFQKIPVMGHHHQSALEPAEPVLQPRGHLRVQMVGRLIQNQHIRRMDQRRRQSHPLPLSAGKGSHLLLVVRQSQPVEHGFGLILVQLPEFFGKVQEYLLQNRGVVLHGRVLLQQAHLHIGVPGNRSGIGFQPACQHFQKRGLAGAVNADDADLVPFVQIKIHILQQLAAAEVDGKMLRR